MVLSGQALGDFHVRVFKSMSLTARIVCYLTDSEVAVLKQEYVYVWVSHIKGLYTATIGDTRIAREERFAPWVGR